jgi:sugar transferase (PEP-CTERM/EpsH1 system associated)
MGTLSKIKVMHILPSLETGGMENGVVNLANRINKDRFSVGICCLQRLGSLSPRIEPGIEVLNMGQKEGKAILLPVRLAKILRNRRIDIVHTHNGYSGIYGLLAAKIAGVAVSIHGEHGLTAHSSGYRRNLMRVLCGMADKISTVSEGLKKDAQEYWHIKENKVIVLRNGVDHEKFRRMEGVDRMHFGIRRHEGDIVIGTVGRLADQKNYPLLLRALKEIDNTNVKAVFVGDGPLRPDLEMLVDSLGIRQNVFFMGERQDIPSILNVFDIFVLPSYMGEGIANCMLEAMAVGLPIISSDIDGNIEVVEDEKNGLLFESTNLKSLVEKMVTLIGSENLRKRMGDAGIKRVEHHFSIEKMVSNYERFYTEMIEEKV